MSGSTNESDSQARSVLGPASNLTKSAAMARKPVSKPLRKIDRAELLVKNDREASSMVTESLPPSPPMSAPAVLSRQELLLRSYFSMNASCSSDASTDSFCSRASTGRIGRPGFSSRQRQSCPKPEKIVANLDKIVPYCAVMPAVQNLQGKKRCAWVTSNSDPSYVIFHDEEWGVPVHDDRCAISTPPNSFALFGKEFKTVWCLIIQKLYRKLFELLVLSGALAELTWPVILSRRHIFREVFMNFDPILVSKINEKKLTAPGSSSSPLLSEPKLRGVVENARLILKITEEFGSFDMYCWSFVNHKPITSRFRYARQVPAKTAKADSISKDLIRRGFRNVGPTVIYSFMQATGMTNDHLIGCHRFEECCSSAISGFLNGEGIEVKVNGDRLEEKRLEDVSLELP